MPTSKKKTATTRVPPTHATKRAPAKNLRKSTSRYRAGVTSATAMRSAKRFGTPVERLAARLRLEAKRGDITPLPIGEKLIKLREAAVLLGISPFTLRNWALTDKVIYRRLGGVLLMIPESEIERLRSFGN